MRISELSRRSGVPVTTIKYYIREGLLPAGERSQRNQAQYQVGHLQRLDLLRALREVAGLSVDVLREVIGQLDKPYGEGDPVGTALEAVYRVRERDRTAAEQAKLEEIEREVEALMRGLDWVLPDAGGWPRSLNVELLADGISQLRKYIDPDYPVEKLRSFAELAWGLSEAIYENETDRVPMPGDDLVDPTRTAVLGTLLIEPIIMALVRSALVMRSMHISGEIPLPPAR